MSCRHLYAEQTGILDFIEKMKLAMLFRCPRKPSQVAESRSWREKSRSDFAGTTPAPAKCYNPRMFWLLTILLCGLAANSVYASLTIRVVSFAIVGLIAVWATRWDFAHPYTWFIPVFSLYSLSGPIATWAGLNPSLEDYAAHAVFLQYLALIAFIMGSLPASATESKKWRPVQADKWSHYLKVGMWPVMIIAWVLSGAPIIYVAITAPTTKMNLARDPSIFGKLQFSFSLLLLSLFSVLAAALSRRRNVPIALWWAAGVWFGLGTVLLQERDLILRFILTSLMIFQLYVRRISSRTIIAVGLVCIAVLGGLGAYRAAVSSGADISVEGVLMHSLFGEFESASRNLMVLLRGFEAGLEYQWGRSFWKDILEQGTASSVFTERDHRQNASAWFNRTFYPSVYASGGSKGFTLVGEAYRDFGVVGVAVLFFLLARSLDLLYRRRHLCIPSLVYSLIIAGVLYSVRMDFACLLSYTIKQFLLPMLLVIALSAVVVEAARLHRGRWQGSGDLADGSK